MDLYVAHILILMLNFWKNKSLTCNFFFAFYRFSEKGVWNPVCPASLHFPHRLGIQMELSHHLYCTDQVSY